MVEAKGNYRDWWRYPRKYGVDSTSRSVTFLELFYDLVYVVVIAELSHTLSGQLNSEGLLEFLLLFFLVWWGWFNGALYHDLHGNNDIRTRFFTFLQMALIISFAIYAHNALDDGMRGFFVTYGVFVIVLAYLWWRVGVHDPLHQPASRPYSFWYSVFGISFIGVGFLADPFNLYLISLIAFIMLIFPFLLRSRTQEIREANERTQMLSPAAIERFGLFNIIVLGEVIVGVVQGLAEVETLTLKVKFTAGLGLLVAISTWWIYFDLISHHEPKETINNNYTWIFLHLPLSMSIASLGAVILNIIEHSEVEMEAEVRYIFVGSIAVILICTILLIKVIKIPEVHEEIYQRGSYALFLSLILVLSLVTIYLDPIPFLGLIVVFMLFPIFYGVKIWIQLYRTNPEFRETVREF